MGLVSRTNFATGETRRKRISPDAVAFLDRCNGYDPSSGALVPENVLGLISDVGNPLSGTTPEQTPFAYVEGERTTLIARDSSDCIRELEIDPDTGIGDWSGAGAVLAHGLLESTPCRLDRLVIFPTAGPDPKLMAYEPGSPTTKLRPLSLKSPADYKIGSKPTVTQSANPAVRLFNCDDANDWAEVGVGCTLDVAQSDKVVFTMASTSGGSDLLFKKALESSIETGTLNAGGTDYTGGEDGDVVSVDGGSGGTIRVLTANAGTGAVETFEVITPGDGYAIANAITTTNVTVTDPAATGFKVNITVLTGIDLTNKAYLVIDLLIADDAQAYYYAGLFANNAALYPSGYILNLFSDTACTSEIVSYPIPRLQPEGKVNRVALLLRDLTDTAKGIGISSAAYYTPPETGNTHTLTAYSETFADDWTHKGNFLEPSIVWDKSPVAETLTQISDTTEKKIVLPTVQNVVLNPGFESGQGVTADDWTLQSYARRRKGYGRSGEYGCCMTGWHKVGDSAAPTEPIVATDLDGIDCELEIWYAAPKGGRWKVTIFPDAGLDIVYPSTGWTVETPTGHKNGKVIWSRFSRVFTMPPGTTVFDITIETAPDYYYAGFRIDDVSVRPANIAAHGSAWILETFTESGEERDPEAPLVRWAYCFAGKHLLGTSLPDLMVSNPSDASAPDVYADPWRTYSLAIDHTEGPITALAVGDGGTGYSVGDTIEVDGGTDGIAVVSEIDPGGVVTTLELVKAGSGYETDTAIETTSEDGGANDLTVDVTTTDLVTDYGDYLEYYLVYRQIYDGITKTWSPWKFVGSVAIPTPIEITAWEDMANDADPVINLMDVPEEMEIRNDYASSSRFVTAADGRVYAGCLDWDGEPTTGYLDGQWQRQTYLAVSSYGKPWAYPTTTDADSPVTDGTELAVPLAKGSEIRGILSRNDDKYIFMDNEFFLLRGDNPATGWQFARLDSVNCVSNRTIADCRKMIVWHDGNHFNGYGGGVAEPISRFAIDSTLIDWTAPHNALYYDSRYILYCKYGGVGALIIYDIDTGSWRIRRSTGLDLVGICTDGENVYGVTTAGDAVNLFGSDAADYGATSTVRQVWTEYLIISGSDQEVEVQDAIFEVVTEESGGVDLDLTFDTHSRRVSSTVTRTLNVVPTETRYTVGLNLTCEAISVKVEYEGETPPEIHMVGVILDERAAI